jgi:hypothetical protein
VSATENQKKEKSKSKSKPIASLASTHGVDVSTKVDTYQQQ